MSNQTEELGPKPLQPPCSLLMGPAGSGKTTSIATYAKMGIECFVVITEPTGADSLLDAWEREHLDPGLLHYSVIPPSTVGWSALREMGVKINNMSYKDLAEIRSGIGKEHMKQWDKLMRNMENFHDDRTGETYGDATTLGPNCALILDSLSGFSLIALQNAVGYKPSPHQGEWGAAMSQVENVINKLTSDCNCFFTMTAHIEREPDEISGMSKVTVSTLGKKLPPKIPRFFSEVVRTRKDSTGKFLWATIDSEADLKNRALKSSANLPQDFGPIVEAYRRRVEQGQTR
jgi:hypothetical protein